MDRFRNLGIFLVASVAILLVLIAILMYMCLRKGKSREIDIETCRENQLLDPTSSNGLYHEESQRSSLKNDYETNHRIDRGNSDIRKRNLTVVSNPQDPTYTIDISPIAVQPRSFPDQRCSSHIGVNRKKPDFKRKKGSMEIRTKNKEGKKRTYKTKDCVRACDVKDKNEKNKKIKHSNYIIPSGLINTNETCYMNSMVQAVAASEVFIHEYENLISSFGSSNECVKLKRFVQLLEDINNSEYIKCDAITSNLISIMKMFQWQKSSQQDSFQLLCCFINAMQADIKPLLVDNNLTMPGKLKMLHSFRETPQYNKVQDHLGMALPLCGAFREWPGTDLRKLIDEFFKPSVIDDGPNETQISLFEKPPTVLIFHIQANEWSESVGTYIKPKYYIQYEQTLTYSFRIEKEMDRSKSEVRELSYNLVAVVHHMGDVSGGHYITYRKNYYQWFLVNDLQVEPVSFDCTVVPYILIYEMVIN